MAERKQSSGILGWIERVGNKIPHPFMLFLYLLIIVGLISMVLSMSGASVENPSTGEIIEVKSIFSGEGMTYALTNMVKNFTGFAPLGLILTMTLGLGLAEDVGFMGAFMKSTILGAPNWAVTFMVFFIGICGNIASDAAIVIIPPLAGIIYLYLGRHPLAGIAAGYAGTTAGFTANVLPAGTDALLQGITNEATAITNGPTIELTANWYFMFASTFLIAFVGTIINNKIIEPRLGEYHGKAEITDTAEVTPEEKKALRKSGLAALVYVLFIVAVAIPSNSFFRNPETGSLLVRSTLMSSLIPLLLGLFLVVGITYGVSVGLIKSSSDVPVLMTKAIKGMASFIVLAFIIGQFIGWFNWTNLGLLISVNLANAIKGAGFVGIPLFISFILVCTTVNLFIGSGSAKWSLLAPIFVPMFNLLGYHPGWTQLLYRIGDSCTNVISPLFNYLPIILAFMQEYDEEAGIGTLISLMIPYSLIFLAVWSIFAMIWFAFGLPIGPGTPIFI